MRARRSLAEDGRGRGLDRDDPDGGILLLEIGADARDRAARADAGDKDIDFSVRVRPDLRTGRRLVDGGVGRVDELAGDKGLGQFFRQFLGLGDGALHALGAFGENQLGTVGAHELTPLDAHRLGHDDDDAIAPRRRNRGKTDSGVAGGGLDDDGIGIEQSPALGVVDHRLGDAVLDRAGGVEIFKLGQQTRLQLLFLFDMRQLQQRGLSDQLIGGCKNNRHVKILLKISIIITSFVSPQRLHRLSGRIISGA